MSIDVKKTYNYLFKKFRILQMQLYIFIYS